MSGLSDNPGPDPNSFAPVIDAGIEPVRWNPALRVAFRFVFLYLGLYNFVVLANTSGSIIPGVSFLVQKYTDLWHAVVPWVGRNILHLANEITYFPSGSGDKTSDWVQLLCYFTIAVTGCIAWSTLDWQRPNYIKLHEWLVVLVRYSVAFTMLSYGMSKVIKLQFPDPSLARYIEPFGEFSPMGVLWTFMGVSTGYTFFGGAGEVIGGLLLFFRRTATIGAMVTFGVMLNVAMLNFCYDVPVKLLSSHLTLMCVFLMLPAAWPLIRLLVLNQTVTPAAALRPHFLTRWGQYAGWAVKAVFVIFAIYSNTSRSLEAESRYGPKAPKPALYGIWDIEEFTRNGEVVPPSLTEAKRWRKFVSPTLTSATVRMMDDSVQLYRAEYDAGKSTLAIVPSTTAAVNAARSTANTPNAKIAGQKDVLQWERPDPDHLILQGTVEGQAIVARMKRIDETKYNLVSRGFHWVSELPFNK